MNKPPIFILQQIQTQILPNPAHFSSNFQALLYLLSPVDITTGRKAKQYLSVECIA